MKLPALIEVRLARVVAMAAVAALSFCTAAQASDGIGVTGTTGTTDVASVQAVTSKTKTKQDVTGPTGVAAERIALSVNGTYRQGATGYVLAGALVSVRGELSSGYDGLGTDLTIKRGKRVVKTASVSFKIHGKKSSFVYSYRIKRAGYYRFSAVADASAVNPPEPAHSKYVSVVSASIGRGGHGVAIKVIQAKLDRLGYVVPRSGTFDDGTGRALIAFRKVNGMARVEEAGRTVGSKLARNKGAFKLKYPKGGKHIEVDISRQVMAFAEKGKVVRVYHVSTGAPGTPTVRGRFHVYRKDFGTNQKGMVHSNYFIRGYAVHGYASVPTYNASHGCVRVPVPNAVSIFNWIKLGDRVDVYN
ncbi:MAG: L,D-transpeptidase family protein [Thermoleophilaceae bacterium]|nr:L,D-transpeptidase family protein [Thermoleophilaceae bacterium]